jgi:hypothetical protein
VYRAKPQPVTTGVRHDSSGMYEILDYDSTLTIKDAKGKRARLERREHIKLLQDNVVAIHDHAWGDGELFAAYRCRPGTAVDFYQDGSKWNVLISLRETKNRGDALDFRVEREIKDGLTQRSEWLETEVDHLMRRLCLSIIFPQARRCRRAVLVRRTTSQTLPLGEKHFAYLGDGCQKLTWEINVAAPGCPASSPRMCAGRSYGHQF